MLLILPVSQNDLTDTCAHDVPCYKQAFILCICSIALCIGFHLIVVGVTDDHLSRVGIPVSILHSNMTTIG